MELTNEVLQKMNDKQKYNIMYKNYYNYLANENRVEGLTKFEPMGLKYFKRSQRIGNCMTWWNWDIYHNNKLMDLNKVNRCMNNRFCPNCKKLDLAKFIHSYGKVFNNMLSDNYNPYLVTLTVPNVKGYELKSEIEKMNKSFSKFFRLFSEDFGQGKHGFKDRLMKFDGALKVLEITYNKEKDSYHPHFHCMMFSKEYNEGDFKKDIQGAWSNKKQEYLYNSEMDIQIMKLWYMCHNKIRLSSKEYNNLSDNWFDLHMCDIREMNSEGIYEVLKYTFKDSDISSYEVFKTIVLSLENKRIRQGYGLLKNLKCEDVEEGTELSLEEFLEIDKKETPEKKILQGIQSIIKDYTNYRKISRKSHMREYILNNLE